MMQRQATSVTIVATPVSGTKYEWREGATGAGAALGTQKNVRIIAIYAYVTWATTQPTPLEVHLTIDGNAITLARANPVSATVYYGEVIAEALGTGDYSKWQSFLDEGRSVKVEVEVTWATTQPTNLTMGVRWAKIP